MRKITLIICFIISKIITAKAQSPEIQITASAGGININNGDNTPSSNESTLFGSLDINSGNTTYYFNILNIGPRDLILSGSPKIQVTGTNPGDFTITNMPNISTIANTGVWTFGINFNPSAIGNRSAMINIPNNDSDEAPFTFKVQGTGMNPLPEIDIKGNGISIVNGDITPSTSDNTDFGNVNINTGAISKNFVVYNTGTGNLVMGGYNMSGSGFTASNMPSGITITPGSSHTFNISFDPSTIGESLISLTLNSNDSDEPAYTFKIKGTGINPLPEIDIKGNGNSIANGDLSPSILDNTDFGNINLNSGNVTKNFMVHNTGTGNLVIGGYNMSGSGFTASNMPSGAIILPGDSHTFSITFHPNTLGVNNITLTLNSNDSDEPAYTFKIRATTVITTSLEELENSKILAYPIPSIDIITLEETIDISSVHILNEQGINVRFEKLNNNQIDISNLNKGIYYIIYFKNNLPQPIKIIKN